MKLFGLFNKVSPKINRQQAVQKLEQQLDMVTELLPYSRESKEFQQWYHETKTAISYIFGEESRQLQDFLNIHFYLPVAITRSTQAKYQNTGYSEGLQEAQAILQSFITEMQEYWDETDMDSSVSAIHHIEHLCHRFHLVVQQLQHRYDNRVPLQIEDEHDAQDVFRALLHIAFDDIREEEWTPSYAGGCSRIDFLLKPEKIAIELKKTRKGLTAKGIGEQLLVDIQKYQIHPFCRTLICFVYDPEQRIVNPRGVENDLQEVNTASHLEVKVFIRPIGL